jgi:hypothetical protein
MNIIIALAAVIGFVSLLFVRQSRRAKRVLRSLAPEDRSFIADELEPITRLPLNTAEDEDAWYAATRAAMDRIGTRLPQFGSEVLPRFFPYFNDSDVFRREPDYRASQERRVIKFIHDLRAGPQKI